MIASSGPQLAPRLKLRMDVTATDAPPVTDTLFEGRRTVEKSRPTACFGENGITRRADIGESWRELVERSHEEPCPIRTDIDKGAGSIRRKGEVANEAAQCERSGRRRQRDRRAGSPPAAADHAIHSAATVTRLPADRRAFQR